jgi:hypothetical protein
MATKNKVFFLEFEGDEPEFIGLIDVEEGVFCATPSKII